MVSVKDWSLQLISINRNFFFRHSIFSNITMLTEQKVEQKVEQKEEKTILEEVGQQKTQRRRPQKQELHKKTRKVSRWYLGETLGKCRDSWYVIISL